MGNYGFRISKNGIDVKSGQDVDMVVTSKYPNLKGALSGTVVIAKTADDQTKTVVTHNFGYIPIAQVYMYAYGDWSLLPHILPQATLFNTTSTTLNVFFGSWFANGNYTFKYFIFIDKAKL